MYIDIKRFTKNEKEFKTLIQAMRICNQDIGMEFGIEKCTMLIMKMGKREITDGSELPNQEEIRTLGEREIYKYSGILEADTIPYADMIEKIKKVYLRITRKILETKPYSRNLIKGINTWAVPLVSYSGPFLKSTKEDLQQMDQRTRKLMTIQKAFHHRDNVNELYVSRKEGGRRVACSQDSVDASIQQL